MCTALSVYWLTHITKQEGLTVDKNTQISSEQGQTAHRSDVNNKERERQKKTERKERKVTD